MKSWSFEQTMDGQRTQLVVQDLTAKTSHLRPIILTTLIRGRAIAPYSLEPHRLLILNLATRYFWPAYGLELLQC